jgi:hypothetical protein
MTREGMEYRYKSGTSLFSSPASLGCKPNTAMPLAEHYSPRLVHEVEADGEMDALHTIWDMYQNLDENHQTPDRLQSMQSGDLVHVKTTDRWWLVLSIGWDNIAAPEWAE